ncbi:sodium-translocating pyrophosphatase [Candidatus Kuenenbacteria bacterium RIFCSPHIGHO2_02_FULL_39_13]|uniref:Putative K(+)-stimulated pyrophosphate-energized sodium pump n=1 Tax=Candidatus Kuenenbacteria bacterium RIFCSPHIGHO2_02_FULL_39_13 TaxID=1798561 RepID=A0A1F6FLM1_9BACT|nr:MAG: sodium-translocating pyrophosphatase [Candidatus Kuenenbacteria bacterium RIFCSPHIGHO2_02_FULL_39_13]
MSNSILIPIVASVLALVWAIILARSILRQRVENEKALEIAGYIAAGARAFLKKEQTILAGFVILVAVLAALTPIGWQTGVAILLGAVLSGLAGQIGMRIATSANVRCAEGVRISLFNGLSVAFNSGLVMGLTVVGLGLLGVSVLYLIFQDPVIIYGFGLGASFVALFARVGGGIYTKAADVGADLVGKIEAGIPEDDPRNPAVIADNVGDNVGDVAGMGADLFESYVDSIIATMMLGVFVHWSSFQSPIIFPIFVAALGIAASILGSFVIKAFSQAKPQKILNVGIFASAILFVIFIFIANQLLFNDLKMFWVLLIGLVTGVLIGLITEFYTSHEHQPTQKLAEAATTGAGTNIISGLALGMQSTALPVILVSLAILAAYKIFGLYGVGISAVGMLSTLGLTLATDSYGPVADNAAGIAEMADMGEEVRKGAEELDAVGNTTAAIGKGFAIASAALTAMVLAVSFSQVAKIETINILMPEVIAGFFIGAMYVFLFCSMAMKAVGRAAYRIVEEVRRQFREIKGIMAGTAKPEYERCVAIATGTALKQMILPSILAVLIPVAVGFTLGAESLGGLLIGAVVSGFLMAVMMANAGGAWDNAKKYIETGKFGGKGSAAHKAAVVGDTVGDPFKDTAGPSLNILIKLMAIVSLIIAPLL